MPIVILIFGWLVFNVGIPILIIGLFCYFAGVFFKWAWKKTFRRNK
jgi:hypothetical protein